MLVSNKVFENKGAVLRPFRARDVEAEAKMVGRALCLPDFTPGFQKSLLEKEFMVIMNRELRGLPFACRDMNDVLDLYLVLSGKKPASILSFGDSSLRPYSPTLVRFGKYAPFYARISDALSKQVMLVSRDLASIERLDSLHAELRDGRPLPGYFNDHGLALGYPKEAVEEFAFAPGDKRRSEKHVASFIEHDMQLTAPVWNARFVPVVRDGKAFNMELLQEWNSALERGLGSFPFSVTSASRKLWKMELLLACLEGREEWGEKNSERSIREAIERAYGTLLSVGY